MQVPPGDGFSCNEYSSGTADFRRNTEIGENPGTPMRMRSSGLSNTNNGMMRTVLTLCFPLALTFQLMLASAPAAYGQVRSDRELLQRRVELLEQQLATASGDRHREILGELEWVRRRLQVGDFRSGDVIVLLVRGDSILSDTFQVEPPRDLVLPGMEPIDLSGVLRDELQPHLEREISRFIRNPQISAYPLIRVGVLGGVRAPGFYLFRPSTPVVDVFRVAGGFQQWSNTDDIELRRAGQTVLESERMQQALIGGWDLLRLDVQSADVVYVPPGARPLNTREIVLTGIGVASFAVNMLFAFGVF